MSSIDKSGAYTLGTRTVKRVGYGAMQLAGPGVVAQAPSLVWAQGALSCTTGLSGQCR